MSLLLLLSVLSLFVVVADSTSQVWRDKSLRYTGFRYELSKQQEFDLKSLIQSRAESLFCFGWVQDSRRDTIVGEARCKKEAGEKMMTFLIALCDESNILVYEDSLIRLHPSSFKVMQPGRNTCFREEPHKCSHLYFQGEDGTPFHER